MPRRRSDDRQASEGSSILVALSLPRPGHLAVYRWLPEAWEPGRECLERQRLAALLRAEGWEFVREEMIGDPVAGTLYLFRRRSETVSDGTEANPGAHRAGRRSERTL